MFPFYTVAAKGKTIGRIRSLKFYKELAIAIFYLSKMVVTLRTKRILILE